jgi:spore germination cell wall hydrolase CwlJ-like protein
VARAHGHGVLHRRRRGRAVPLAVVAVVLTAPARTGPPAPAPAAPAAEANPYFRALASPFGTIHEATFRFSPPVGAGIPAVPDFRLAAADDGAPAADGEDSPRDGPDGDGGLNPALRRTASPRSGDADGATAETNSGAAPDRDAVSDGYGAAVMRMAPIFFVSAFPGAAETVAPAPPEPWPEEPPEPEAAGPSAALPDDTAIATAETAGAGLRPKSPAALLDLGGAARARQEKCLADAIYFEARGEPERGQMAVAQVVINRVFSGYYPGNVCGVVYQSTHRRRHVRCQFSFTCDGIPDRITEPDAWERATRIARDALDGAFWLDGIGKATHYHARWVHPRWVHEMRRLDRIGVHTFYRPRRWGDGAAAPVWGDAGAKAEKL